MKHSHSPPATARRLRQEAEADPWREAVPYPVAQPALRSTRYSALSMEVGRSCREIYPKLGWDEVQPHACEMWSAYESCTGLQWADVEETVRYAWQAAEQPGMRYAAKLPHR